jgi:hypothetical protein
MIASNMNVGHDGIGTDLKTNAGKASAKQSGILSGVMFALMMVAAGAFGIWAGAQFHSPFLSGLIAPHLRTATVITKIFGPSAPAATAPPAPGPVGIWTSDPADLENPNKPVTISRLRKNAVSMILISGGVAGARRAPTRHEVMDFVKRAGATAGLNGTFFANASLNGTDNKLIGPSLCGDEPDVVIGPFDKRSQLINRPLVLMSSDRTKIVPYDPDTMDDSLGLRNQLSTVSDAFLGGVWLVHNGVAANSKRLASFHVKDANDYRRRAFFAVMMDGRPALGATDCSVSSLQLAKALEMAQVREAVLLDSGFSTSLVYQNNILVSGHSTKRIPSRPIPQAILLFGYPASQTKTASAENIFARSPVIQ